MRFTRCTSLSHILLRFTPQNIAYTETLLQSQKKSLNWEQIEKNLPTNQKMELSKLAMAWVFSSSFLLMGLMSFFENPLIGGVLILWGIFLLPPFRRYLKDKLHYNPSKKIMAGIFFIGVFIMILSTPRVEQSKSEPLHQSANITEGTEKASSFEEASIEPQEATSQNTTVETTPTIEATTLPTITIEAEPTEPTIALEPETFVPVKTYECGYNSYNCGDFSSHTAAQSVFDYCWGEVGYDVHDLDRDNDGDSCETLH